MAADNDFYRSARLAYGYAHHRPPVHPFVIAKMREMLGLNTTLPRALDVGCGAGLSTAALLPLARAVVGIDPMIEMLAHRRAVTTQADFVVAQAEALPFAAQSFDLVTAAGALNYTDLTRFFPELARVLTPDGRLVIYDFSAGRRLRADARLDDWFAAFKARYPVPPGYALDVHCLPYEEYGLHLTAHEAFEVAVPLTRSSYLQYALSETSVELAIAQGVPEAEIADWCSSTLREIFGDQPREVLFDAYLACVRLRG